MAVSQEELLDRTAGLLARQPTASMEDLAQAGGISRATLFRRYASREELVRALCHRAVQLFTEATAFLGDAPSAPPAPATTEAREAAPRESRDSATPSATSGGPRGGSRGSTAGADLAHLVAQLAPLGALYGVLSTQPAQRLLEAELLAGAERGEQRVRDLVRRGQREGAFRNDVDPEWVLTAMTWLLVGAADGVRLGRLPSARTEAMVLDALQRLLHP